MASTSGACLRWRHRAGSPHAKAYFAEQLGAPERLHAPLFEGIESLIGQARSSGG